MGEEVVGDIRNDEKYKNEVRRLDEMLGMIENSRMEGVDWRRCWE